MTDTISQDAFDALRLRAEADPNPDSICLFCAAVAKIENGTLRVIET
jgi:hypothetical protein